MERRVVYYHNYITAKREEIRNYILLRSRQFFNYNLYFSIPVEIRLSDYSKFKLMAIDS